MRLSRSAMWFSFLFSLTIVPNALAETNAKVADNIQCSITTESVVWSHGKPILATATIKNLSGKQLNFRGIYAFMLEEVNASASGKPVSTYWSPVNIRTGTTIKQKVEIQAKKGIVYGESAEETIQLEPGELKTIKVDLSKVYWGRVISSLLPHETIDEVVPKGEYDLTGVIEVDGREENGHYLTTHIASNKIRVVTK